MKKIISLVMVLVLTASIVPTASISNAEEVIIKNDSSGIPSKELYQAILEELEKKPDEFFTQTEAETVRYLWVIGAKKDAKKVISLQGIEKLKRLEMLTISNTKIDRYDDLVKVKNLNTLVLKNVDIKNLTFLKKLLKLRELRLIDFF